jgi:hypothetical protein
MRALSVCQTWADALVYTFACGIISCPQVGLQSQAETTDVFDVTPQESQLAVACTHWQQDCAGLSLVVLSTLIHLVSWSY